MVLSDVVVINFGYTSDFFKWSFKLMLFQYIRQGNVFLATMSQFVRLSCLAVARTASVFM